MSEPSAKYWSLTEHVCLACLGRVLESAPLGTPKVYRCANCGVEAAGRQGLAHPPICACGMKHGRKDAGVRCVRNERPRPELLCEIVAREIP